MLAFSRSFSKPAYSGLKPLFDRVIVQRVTAPDRTAGGILLPESMKQNPNEAIVLEVGPGRRDKDGNFTPLALKQGDKVILADWGGNEIKINGKEYLILREDDILGVIE